MLLFLGGGWALEEGIRQTNFKNLTAFPASSLPDALHVTYKLCSVLHKI